MARTWLSIRVDLVEGHGEQYRPRPGRIFAAARSHTFRQLADAIDDAFARWDRSHLQEFTLTGQIRLCRPDRDWEIEGEITEDYQRVKLSRLRPGEQFVYVFDLGDDWAHLCTVGAQRMGARQPTAGAQAHGTVAGHLPTPGQHQPATPGRAATAVYMRVVAGNGHYSWRPGGVPSAGFPRPRLATVVRAGKLRTWKQAGAGS